MSAIAARPTTRQAATGRWGNHRPEARYRAMADLTREGSLVRVVRMSRAEAERLIPRGQDGPLSKLRIRPHVTVLVTCWCERKVGPVTVGEIVRGSTWACENLACHPPVVAPRGGRVNTHMSRSV